MAEIKTVSGSVVTFDDAEATALESLITGIVATQEGGGAPSPSNVRPISGFDSIKVYNAGKNVCGGEAFADNIVNVVNSSRAIKGEDSDGKYVRISASYDINHKAFAINKFKPNTQYTLVIKAKKHSTRMVTNLAWRYTDGTIASISFPTGTENDTAVTFVVSSASNKSVSTIEGYYGTGYTDIYYEETGVFEGVVTVDDFVPFRPFVTTEVQLGQTVYGGSLNVTTGELTITHGKIVLDGTQNIRTVNWRPTDTTRAWLYYYNVTNNKTFVSSVLPDALCDTEPIITYIDMYNGIEGVALYTGTQYGLLVRVADTSLETVEAINTYLAENPITVVYPLATPITVQLSATTVRAVSGVNTIWSDSGDVEVSYRVYEEQTDWDDIFSSRDSYNNQILVISTKSGVTSYVTNDDISSEDLRIEQGISESDELRFGGFNVTALYMRVRKDIDFLNNSQIEVRLYSVLDTNKRVRIVNDEPVMYDISSDTSEQLSEYDYFVLGLFDVESDRLTSDKKYREIVGYDLGKAIADTDIRTAYDTIYDALVTETNPNPKVTIGELKEGIFTALGVADNFPNTAVNYNVQIARNITSTKILLRDFIKWYCEANGIFALAKGGQIQPIDLNLTVDKAYDRYEQGELEYEEEDTKSITSVVIVDEVRGYRETATTSDPAVTWTNEYVIQTTNNPLLGGMSKTDLHTIADNLLTELSTIVFRPLTVVTYGDMCVEVGNRISFTLPDNSVIETYVLGRVFEGIQRMSDSIEARGNSYYESSNYYDENGTSLYMARVNPEGIGSFSMNRKANTTVGNYSNTTGFRCEASGESSHAEGLETHATNPMAHAEGCYTTSSGQFSHAEGYRTVASNTSAHAEGHESVASGNFSHAEGGYTEASNVFTHAEGYYSKATAEFSHAEGNYTIASGSWQHVGGKFNVADTANAYAEIIGNGNSETSRSNARTLDWNGNEVLAGTITLNGLSANMILGTDANKKVVEKNINNGYSMLSLTDSNVSSGSYIYKQFVIPESGLYYIHLIARWAGNASGYRSITLTDSSTGETLADNSVYTFHKDELPPTNNAFISHSSGLLRVTSNNKYLWLRVFQNSGSTLGTNFRVQFVKLTDSTSVIT